MTPKYVVVCLACFPLLLSKNSAAQDDFSQSSITQVKRADALLQSGTFSYNQHPEEVGLYVNSTDAFIKERNPQWHEEIVADRTITLTFAKNGAFIQTTRIKTPKQTQWRTVYDGEDTFQIFPVNNGDWEKQSVVISSGGKLDESWVWMLPYPGPCALQGHGLSLLKNPVVERQDSQIVLRGSEPSTRTGKLPSDAVITATLDAGKGYIATKIERFFKGALSNRITLSNPAQAPNGAWYAKNAFIESFMNGRMVASARYNITCQTTDSPPASLFEVRIEQGMSIQDQRLGKGAHLEKRSPGTMTKQQLLVFTKKELVKQAGINAADARETRRLQAKRLIPLTLFGVVGVAFLLSLFSHRKLSKKEAIL